MKINKIILFALFFSLALPALSQQIAFPSDDMGKRAALFLAMVNSSGDESVKDFIVNVMVPNPNLTLDQRLERFRGMRANLAGGKLVKILAANDEQIEFVVETAKGELKKVNMGLTPDTEKRVAGVGIQDYSQAAAPAAAAKPLAPAEFATTLDKYLNDLTATDKFSGAVLIAKDGKPIFNNAYGFADRENKIRNKLDTKFNIGSENKMFTQLAIGILADEGKLALNDKLGKYLPDYPNKEAAEKITIEQLIAMKSGIGDFYGPEFVAADKSKLRTLKDYLPFFAARPLLFEPGTGSRYSNGGYIVLGLIIENISGKSYYDFVRERIYKPAGMNDTGSYAMDDKIANIAIGYMKDDSAKLVPNFPEKLYRGISAGGGYSTVGDMLKFANALESGKLPTPKSFNESADPTVKMIASGPKVAGGSPGVNAAFSMKLKGGYTVIVMSNLDPPSAEETAKQIRIWLGA